MFLADSVGRCVIVILWHCCKEVFRKLNEDGIAERGIGCAMKFFGGSSLSMFVKGGKVQGEPCAMPRAFIAELYEEEP